MSEKYIARTQGERIQIETLEVLKNIDKSLKVLSKSSTSTKKKEVK